MIKYVIAFAMVIAFGVAAMGLYLDTKPRQVGVPFNWTIEQVHCAVYSDCRRQ